MFDENKMKAVFSMRLGILREKKRMSQMMLATRVGITQESISAMERGVVAAKLSTLVRIADELGCSVDYLLGRSDVINPAIGVDLLDSHQQHLLKNFKHCDSKNKETLLLLSDIYANKKIVFEFDDGTTIIKNFLSSYDSKEK